MSLDFAQIKELLEILRNSNIGEFKLELRDFSLNVRTDKYISHKGQSSGTFVTATMPTMQQPQQQQIALPTTNSVAPVVNNTTPVATNTPAAEEQPKAANVKYTEIKSPMVGTFYRAGGPDKPPFVKVGDVVEKDSVLCVIEAMKLFNNVVAEQSGRIVKVLVENATPVEYDQPIFLIEPA